MPTNWARVVLCCSGKDCAPECRKRGCCAVHKACHSPPNLLCSILSSLPQITDLHRHFIDHLTIPSRKGKGQLRRVDDVFDCWFESGSMPYAQVRKGAWVGCPAPGVVEASGHSNCLFVTCLKHPLRAPNWIGWVSGCGSPDFLLVGTGTATAHGRYPKVSQTIHYSCLSPD
jgi:hypothetical protein